MLLSMITILAEESGGLGSQLIFALIGGLIIGGITVFILKSELNSVSKQETAKEYQKADSFQISDKKDFFLYKKVEKTEIPQQTPPPKQ